MLVGSLLQSVLTVQFLLSAWSFTKYEADSCLIECSLGYVSLRPQLPGFSSRIGLSSVKCSWTRIYYSMFVVSKQTQQLLD